MFPCLQNMPFSEVEPFAAELLAAELLAVAFFAAAFLAGVFFAAAFLAGVFLLADFFFAVCFLATAMVFLVSCSGCTRSIADLSQKFMGLGA
jgi:hypothetical protein